MRILLIAGHGAGDSGAVGNGYKEADLTREVVSLLAPKLGQLCRVDIADISKNWYEYLKSHTYNFRNYDYVLEIHFNSYDSLATGTEIYVTTSENGIGVETAIVQQMCAAVGYKNRGVKRKNYDVISAVKAQGVSSALLEVCFIDSTADIKTYQSRKNDIVNAIVSGIAEGFGLQRKEETTVPKTLNDISGHYAEKHIQKLLDYGIVNGDDNGNYRPDDPITRADAAIIAANVLTCLGK